MPLDQDSGTTRVHWAGTDYAISLRADGSGGTLGIFEATVPAGEGPPPHIHHAEDEVVHVLEGLYEFWMEGETFTRGPGETVFIPRGKRHTFRVKGDGPGRNLTVVTPGGFEAFFIDMAAEDLQIPRDMAHIFEVAARYSLEFTGPMPWID